MSPLRSSSTNSPTPTLGRRRNEACKSPSLSVSSSATRNSLREIALPKTAFGEPIAVPQTDDTI